MPTHRVGALLTYALGTCVLACGPRYTDAQLQAPRSPTPPSIDAPITVETVTGGLEHPWALAFLPDGRLVVTERPGRLRIVDAQGHLSAPLDGVPAVAARGQGGLLDVAVDPRFADNRTIYLSYAEPGDGGVAGTAVARAKLGEGKLEDVAVIYRQQPKVTGGNHFGSRIVFARDGTLFVTLGERSNPEPRVLAQDLNTHFGKTIRINKDGTVPRNNPFVGRANARPENYTWGQRNVQAAALHPTTGQLWTIEHGPRGGDELNKIEPGKNYGWPTISYGVEYQGPKLPGGRTQQQGMEQPVYYWDPVIAPSGMIFYTGALFPAWRNNIFVGGMGSQKLVRLVLNGDRVVGEEWLLQDQRQRIRDVNQGPDGAIYVATDGGSILRVAPAR